MWLPVIGIGAISVSFISCLHWQIGLRIWSQTTLCCQSHLRRGCAAAVALQLCHLSFFSKDIDFNESVCECKLTLSDSHVPLFFATVLLKLCFFMFLC